MKTYLNILLLSFMMIFFSCSKDSEPEIVAPTIVSKTNTASEAEITFTSLKIKGNVSSTGGSPITARGVCYSKNPSPTIADAKTTEATDDFESKITGLEPNVKYYFRVYATNSIGTSYGPEQAYSTLTMAGTTWDFNIIYSPTVSWHADVVFNADGTTLYDEPANPGIYIEHGKWSIKGDSLTYYINHVRLKEDYKLTGRIKENTAAGNWTFRGVNDRTWSAVKR